MVVLNCNGFGGRFPDACAGQVWTAPLGNETTRAGSSTLAIPIERGWSTSRAGFSLPARWHGCPQVVEILEEVERYVHRNRSRLRDGMPPDEWAAIMGPVALKKALRDVNGRFMRACTRLQDAREKYLQEHPEKFTNG